MGPAADRWREDLASWAIPPEILAAAPASPFVFPVELFASRADAAATTLTPSNRRALDALPEGGTVLDVGCGGGAASLPLAARASKLIGQDQSSAMLEAFRERALAAGVAVETVEGSWPDDAPAAPAAEVVVCHHVAYNVPNLAGFAWALTEHARSRVVLELTPNHPLFNERDLWLRFHGVVRPTRPTADDALAVLAEAGLRPEREDWEAEQSGGFARTEDLTAWIRTRLCLPAARDPEIWEAIAPRVRERDGRHGFGPRPLVTLWWPGAASSL